MGYPGSLFSCGDFMSPLPVLLFLDFDGVLHHFFPMAGVSDEENERFYYRPAFEAAIRDLPVPVEIVVASTFRNKYDIDQLRQFFSPDIARKIVGVTPSADVARKILGIEDNGNGDNGPGTRQVEVEAWLKRAGRAEHPWVAIDDFPTLYTTAAVVACQDKFDQHETALLAEAVADPHAFARKYPIQTDQEKKIIVVPASIAKR